MGTYDGEVGCLVDGHWGEWGGARVIEIAADYGWGDASATLLAERHLASMARLGSDALTDEEFELLDGDVEIAEQWLNDVVADDGFSFGWYDGEFFYQPDAWWEETH